MTKYLIDFISGASQDDINAYLSENNCTVVCEFGRFNGAHLVSADTQPPVTPLTTHVINDDTSALTLLTVVPVVQEPVPPKSDMSISDEHNWWKVYSLASVEFNLATTEVPHIGSNVNVYVVDSGIDITHPEFANGDISLLHSFTPDFIDTTGHGTALSSLIMGSTCGLTTAALKVVKIFDKAVATKQSDLLYAFDAIMSDAIMSPNKVSVVNLSWSIAKNEYVEAKIQHLIDAGIAVVVAAGNSGHPIGDVTPASMSSVLTIGSYNANFVPSNFSDYTGTSSTSLTPNSVNHGAINSWAPGENIWCATVGGGYALVSGTSASAAIYSGSLVFNLCQKLTSSNDILPFRRDPTGRVNVSKINKEDRSGLLDLSDPKYAASNNSICTYRYAKPVQNVNLVPQPKIIANVGEVAGTMLFAITKTASYEVLSPDPMPSYITIERNMLCLHPVAEPDSPSGVDVIDFVYKLVLLDGTTYEDTIQVVIIGSAFNVEVLPPDDPLIKITLLLGPCEGDVHFPPSPAYCSPLYCTTHTTWACAMSPAGKNPCYCISM